MREANFEIATNNADLKTKMIIVGSGGNSPELKNLIAHGIPRARVAMKNLSEAFEQIKHAAALMGDGLKTIKAVTPHHVKKTKRYF